MSKSEFSNKIANETLTIYFPSLHKSKIYFGTSGSEVSVSNEVGTSYDTNLDAAYYLFSQKLNAGYKVL